MFGRIKKEVKAPEVVPDLTVDEDRARWIEGETDTVELNWPDINKGEYKLGIVRYDNNQQMSGGSSRTVTENKYVLADRSCLQSYGSDKIAFYAKFIIEAVNVYQLDGADEDITFNISAPEEGAEVSNLP